MTGWDLSKCRILSEIKIVLGAVRIAARAAHGRAREDAVAVLDFEPLNDVIKVKRWPSRAIDSRGYCAAGVRSTGRPWLSTGLCSRPVAVRNSTGSTARGPCSARAAWPRTATRSRCACSWAGPGRRRWPCP